MELTQEQKKKKFEVDGVVDECLPNAVFDITLDIEGKKHMVLGRLSGKMRMNYIRIVKGDKVKVELSPYDLSKARIIYRYKQ